MRLILIVILALILNEKVVAQNKERLLQIGYLAPYISNLGCTIGLSNELKNWSNNSDSEQGNLHQIQISPQLSYFSQLNVAHNFFLNPEIGYKWSRFNKQFYLSTSVGTGYLLQLRRIDGVLDLATGKINYRSEAINYFLPNLNFELGFNPRKNIGFYFKTTYGRKMGFKQANSAYLALSTGILVKIKLYK